MDQTSQLTDPTSKPQIKILYLLSYRDPMYIRTRALTAALACSEGLDVTEIINSRRGPIRYLQLLRAVLRSPRKRYDVVILGFRAIEVVPAARLLFRRTPLLLDALVSPSDALDSEGKGGRIGELAGRVLTPIERRMLTMVEGIIVDTHAQKSFYESWASLPEERVHVVPVGTDSPETGTPDRNATGKLRLLFFGTFLPLHGVDRIIEAVGSLPAGAVDLRLIGGTTDVVQRLAREHQLAPEDLDHSEWVPLQSIIEREIPAADLCLGGPFGNTPQGRRVITGKTFEALSAARPVVIGGIGELDRWGFEDRRNCLVVDQGQNQQLAEVLQWAINNRSALGSIGDEGRDLFTRTFSPSANAERLEEILGGVVASACSS